MTDSTTSPAAGAFSCSCCAVELVAALFLIFALTHITELFSTFGRLIH